MRTARLAGALVLLLGGALAWAPAGASFSSMASGDDSRLVLRGSISMSSTGASYVVPVLLPRQVTVTMGEDMHVHAARGRFPGLILRKDGPGLQQSASDFLAHGCLSKGCHPPHYPFFDRANEFPLVDGERATDATLRTGVMSPGRYHLFVVADGAPMRATLRLHGLSGRLAVHPGSVLTPSISEPAPSVFSPPAGSPSPGQIYSAGSTHRMPSTSGFFFDMVYKVMAGYSPSEVSACRFDGPPDPNVLGPYEYPCSTPTGPVEATFDVLALQDVEGALPTVDQWRANGAGPRVHDGALVLGSIHGARAGDQPRRIHRLRNPRGLRACAHTLDRLHRRSASRQALDASPAGGRGALTRPTSPR